MRYIWQTIGWIFTIFFGLLTISMIILQNWLRVLVLFLVSLLCLPILSKMIKKRIEWTLHPFLRLGLIAGMLVIFGILLISTQATSIYRSPEVKARLMQIYDEKMTGWPVSYEDVFLNTEYGKVHVIVSGPEEAPPMLLLHASGVAGWSWKYNAEERQRLQVPVLFVFGKRDNLVGDPEAAKTLVQDIPDVRVEVLDAGHLMAAEELEQINALILDFFNEN